MLSSLLSYSGQQEMCIVESYFGLFCLCVLLFIMYFPRYFEGPGWWCLTNKVSVASWFQAEMTGRDNKGHSIVMNLEKGLYPKKLKVMSQMNVLELYKVCFSNKGFGGEC